MLIEFKLISYLITQSRQIAARSLQTSHMFFIQCCDLSPPVPTMNRDSGYVLAAIYDDLYHLHHSTPRQVTRGN